MDNTVNILMVDDHPENLLALEAIIERDDYCIVKAASGEEALKQLLKYDFAVILLDVQMPRVDGFETAKIIKAREKTKNIPIIFITANNMDSSHVFNGYSVGAIDYLLKPFDPFVLKAKVEGLVDMYRMNRKLIQQAGLLEEKTRELEAANAALSRTSSELRISEALAMVIQETSIDSMIVLDEQGNILKTNPAVTTMFQYSEAEMAGQSIWKLFPLEESRKYLESLFQPPLLSTIRSSFDNFQELYATRKDGQHFPAEIQVGKRHVQDKFFVACTIRDVTKQKQAQETIVHMAYHDGLTDLPNLRRFHERIHAALSEAKKSNRPLAIMYLDMDRFKYINDSLGHMTGDALLKEVAARLVESTYEEWVVARSGGDEFNILLPGTARERALECAENILQAFQRPFYIDHYELFVTVSIGVSVFPYDGEDAQSLMKHADAALYRAKEQGKNQYIVFHSGMNISSYRTFLLQNDLRKAVSLQQFMLVYQPRIDMKTGAVTSAEALVRWRHPNWGVILPSEFIPLAEEIGMIGEIGDWVLQTACEQSNAWRRAGAGSVRIAVNFSARQFLERDLIQKINRALAANELSPRMLEVEITETLIMGNEEIILRTLKQLKEMEVVVSIDDFGTGYCSLPYLRRFPANTLKIDKSYIQDLGSPVSDSTPLVKAIIMLARSLHMSVIAEGVETEAQANALRRMECEEFQGYLYSPPVPPEEFETFLSASKVVPVSAPADAAQGEPGEFNTSRMEQVLESALRRTQQVYSVSPREFDVFQLMVNGFNNKEISEQLFISEHTVKNHITRIFQKLNVSDRIQAIAKIYQTCMDEGKMLRDPVKKEVEESPS